ncbi:hypothetical protein A3C59_00155 [Candidatus Daviesbacteria bacterium RIFCSPHIGHO2_02_FULL_36_13]|uniref:HTH psq-type domain-containing protein n=1 Tax=Candidatus Daviesbacteria bacterium RIFCSPHIGHO2_02_FULL_36_13 TaxID=1797768 RepID=A0A1F5JYA6_9BACT|nr:MAG: hypothetical protein A3C59_00155 [Candidatus Daviesbacteria bacterium RIFCSPHIGHO2_02_FULL_36_13]OGE42123.1 MAG: hypothetical protein A3A45_00530 [Candidatus Daviesbacteria bacterium RIFCSPLOWO2_01_FULL_36_8]
MKSKWYELKPKAILLRQKGTSLRKVERLLKIPRSTLSGWFKTIPLTQKQQLILKNNHRISLIKARKSAILWHNRQKALRIKSAENEAIEVFSKLNINDVSVLELALAMLYIGEGFKADSGTGMGNSDPLILKFFIKALKKCYNLDTNNIGCELHLRADQESDIARKYWSEALNLPLTNFRSVSIDKRTIGSPTYPTYHGVCVIRYGNIAIQRRLISLANKFCMKIVS